MKKVTLDTNVLPPDEILQTAQDLDYEFAVVTVTEREIEGTDIQVSLEKLGKAIFETAVWDESLWGKAVWGPAIAEDFVLGESYLGKGILGNNEKADLFEMCLDIISNGSFPKRGERKNLTPNQRKQLRDAMILATHLREKRDIFVTNDARAFLNHGRGKKIENMFGTKIMTKEDFMSYCYKEKSKQQPV